MSITAIICLTQSTHLRADTHNEFQIIRRAAFQGIVPFMRFIYMVKWKAIKKCATKKCMRVNERNSCKLDINRKTKTACRPTWQDWGRDYLNVRPLWARSPIGSYINLLGLKLLCSLALLAN